MNFMWCQIMLNQFSIFATIHCQSGILTRIQFLRNPVPMSRQLAYRNPRSKPWCHFMLNLTPLRAPTIDYYKTSMVLTGWKCTFLGLWYPRGIAILDALILDFGSGILMKRKLNKFSIE